MAINFSKTYIMITKPDLLIVKMFFPNPISLLFNGKT